jgi:RHS repeat-associated protein
MASADKGGGGLVYFNYDASGQRVRKVWVHSGIVEERIYLGSYEVYRRRVAGAVEVERQTLHVNDVAGRVLMVETKTIDTTIPAFTPVTRWRFQLSNHLGSASLEVSEAAAVISYEEYHPFGTTAYRSSNGDVEVSAKRYRYTGKERDEETGFGYHGARYLALWLGRWASADPSGLVDGANLFAYCLWNPIANFDPNGGQTKRAFNDADERIAQSTPTDLSDYLRGLTPEALAAFRDAATGRFKERVQAHIHDERREVRYTLPEVALTGPPPTGTPLVALDDGTPGAPTETLDQRTYGSFEDAIVVHGDRVGTGLLVASGLALLVAGSLALAAGAGAVGAGGAGTGIAGGFKTTAAAGAALVSAYHDQLGELAESTLQGVEQGLDPVEAAIGGALGQVVGRVAGRIGGKAALALEEFSLKLSKSISLPAWSKVTVNWVHVLERHVPGAIYAEGRTVFPSTFGPKGIAVAVREAYGSATKVGVQGVDRVLLEGKGTGLTIRMWFNTTTRIIETAFPYYGGPTGE